MLNNVAQIAGIVIMSNFVGPVHFLLQSTPKLFQKLKVKNIKTLPPFDGRIKSLSGAPAYFNGHPLPERTYIELYNRNHITIHHDNFFYDKRNSILERISGDGGSADLGLVIFGFVGVVASLPILLFNELIWKAIEVITHMPRCEWVVYLKLRNQVDDKTRDLIKKAFTK